MILNVDKLTKSFGVRTLFADASFRINERDRVALVGPNGAGKTTMMNIIAGHDSPDSGQVIFSKGDRDRVGEEAVEKANAAGAHLTLSDETRPLRSGFILKSGRVEINCAFETLVRLQRGEISGEVANILFA